ncbi:MAG: hypothetical protein WAX44_03365 [Minisyncoccia bacterium]
MEIQVRVREGVFVATFTGRTDIMSEVTGHGRDPNSAVGDLCRLSGLVVVEVIEDNTPLGDNIPGLQDIRRREEEESRQQKLEELELTTA